MNSTEFYTFESDVWFRDASGKHERLTEQHRDLVRSVIQHLEEFYPRALAVLQERYKRCSANTTYYQFRIVQAFCKCNFGVIDETQSDIDAKNNFHFEHVPCPMRGECPMENVVCHPQFNSKISPAETRVLELVFHKYSEDEIAERLFLSPHTVHNHIRNAYTRIGVREKADFIDYAHKHNLFKEE